MTAEKQKAPNDPCRTAGARWREVYGACSTRGIFKIRVYDSLRRRFKRNLNDDVDVYEAALHLHAPASRASPALYFDRECVGRRTDTK
jgi:hypothetical protein